MTVSEPQALEGAVRAKRARAAGLPQRLKRCVAMGCDAQRRVAERCDAPRRVAYRDVDKSYASNRRPQHGAVARRLQDSAAAIKRAPFVYDAISLIVLKKGRNCVTRCNKTM
jgi:hypothetical protein